MVTTIAPAPAAHVQSPEEKRMMFSLRLQELINLAATRNYHDTPGAVQELKDGTIQVTYAHPDPSRTVRTVYQIMHCFAGDGYPVSNLDTVARTLDAQHPLALGPGVTLGLDPATNYAIIRIAPEASLNEVVMKKINAAVQEEESRVGTYGLHGSGGRWVGKSDPNTPPVMQYFAQKLRNAFGGNPGVSYYSEMQVPHWSFTVNRPATMTLDQMQQKIHEMFGGMFGDTLKYHGAFASTDSKVAFEITGNAEQLATILKQKDPAFVSQAQLN